MQPLMDNLEAQTYETFEKDTVKYTQVCLKIWYFLRNGLLDCWYGLWCFMVVEFALVNLIN